MVHVEMQISKCASILGQVLDSIYEQKDYPAVHVAKYCYLV